MTGLIYLFVATMIAAQPAAAERWYGHGHGHKHGVVVTPYPFPGREVIVERPYGPYHHRQHALWERVRVLDQQIAHLSRELDRHPHAWRVREKRDTLIAERERIVSRLRR